MGHCKKRERSSILNIILSSGRIVLLCITISWITKIIIYITDFWCYYGHVEGFVGLTEFNKFKIPNLSTFQRLLKNVLLIIFLLSVYKMRWFLNLRRIDSGQAGSFIGKIIVPNIYYVIAIQKVAGKIWEKVCWFRCAAVGFQIILTSGTSRYIFLGKLFFRIDIWRYKKLLTKIDFPFPVQKNLPVHYEAHNDFSIYFLIFFF